MNQETKTCQNCQQNFVIEPEDFAFYEKIKVPPPTWCPECRIIRRMLWRPGLVLYKRKCDFSGKEIFSEYHQNSSHKVYDRDIWWSDQWGAEEYGRDLDFSKSFIEQIKDLFLEVPVPARSAYNLVNSDYTGGAANVKNCYMIFQATDSENCLYSYIINNAKDSIDLLQSDSSQLSYDSLIINNCYKTAFSYQCENCIEVYFSRNLFNCSNCFGCINLRNKQYYIFNKPYTKEEYERKVAEFNFGSYKSINGIRKETKDLFLGQILKFASNNHSVNVVGEYIDNSKNVFNGYYVKTAEDCKHIQLLFTPSSNDCYDLTLWGQNCELVYDCCVAGDNSYNQKFSYRCYRNCSDLQYSIYCHSSSNLFGCIGLRNKQYCILNKQYSKEEYEKLIPQIIDHMNTMPYIDKKGRIYKYGEFFPPELSPFAYNETIAQEYFPLTKEQAIEQGYSWKDPEQRNIQITMKSEDLPDHIKDVNDDIVNEIIECANSPSQISKRNLGGQASQCTEAFKIIQPELDFYRKMNLPLPRLCPNCRHYQRLKQRNPLKLWHRKCMCNGANSQPTTNNLQQPNYQYQNTITHFHSAEPCPNEFETTYSPNRQEIIYCEKCYQEEVI